MLLIATRCFPTGLRRSSGRLASEQRCRCCCDEGVPPAGPRGQGSHTELGVSPTHQPPVPGEHLSMRALQRAAWLQHPLRPQGWLRGAPCPTTNLCQGEGAGTAHLCCPQLVWEGDPRAAYSQETLTPGPGAACPSPEQEPHKSPSSVAAPDTAPRNCSSCFALEKAPAPFTINQPPHHGSFLPFKGSS